MDLLASYSSSDSGDESDKDTLLELSASGAKNAAGPLLTARSDSDDSDSSDDDAKAAKVNASKKNGAATSKKKSVLPSVDDLFANSSGPSFLAVAKTEEPVCYTKKRKVEEVARTAEPKAASSSAASIPTPAPAIPKPKPAVRLLRHLLPIYMHYCVILLNFAWLGRQGAPEGAVEP